MEQLFGLIIFGIIAAISGLVKLIEKRKEEQLREQRASRRNVEDLPEATRRMLYGDEGPPVARRRGEGPPPPVAVPRREPASPSPQRQPAPEHRAPQTPPRRQTPPQPQRPPQIPTAAPVRRVQEPSSRRADQSLRDAWSRSRRGAESQPIAPPPAERSSRAAAPSPAPSPRRRRQPSIKVLLHHPKTLRTSIILHEVLGTPKSMR